jgi:hypothetical protein
MDQAIETWEPAVSASYVLTFQTVEEHGYSVLLYHPGAKLPEELGIKPRDLSGLSINLRALLRRAAPATSESLAMYLFDSTLRSLDPTNQDAAPVYMVGMELLVNGGNGGNRTMNVLQDIGYEELKKSDRYFEKDVKIGGRMWTTVVVNVEGTYEPDIAFIIFSGTLIIVASILLAAWMIHNMHQSIEMNRVVMKAAAEAAIVSNLFPANVRERMIEDAKIKQARMMNDKSDKGFLNNDGRERSESLTSEGIFGSKPIAELHPYTTILFADLCGMSVLCSLCHSGRLDFLLTIIFLVLCRLYSLGCK